MLNAVGHQRGGHLTLLRVNDRTEVCSTPLGIKEAGMRRAAEIYRETHECSTPLGIKEAGILGLPFSQKV